MAFTNEISEAVAGNESLKQRAAFRAVLAIDGSVAEAGRVLFKSRGDARAACEEMMREHLTLSFMSTQAAIDLAFGGEISEEDRERARIALGLQRASILMRRNRLLQTLAEKDDVLQYEMAQDAAELAKGNLDEAERAEIEAAIKVAKVCRTDLAALARVVLEQTAIRELVAAEAITSFDAAALERLARAAEERVTPILPALEQGAPLRRALAADLVTEGVEQTQEVAVEAPRKALTR